MSKGREKSEHSSFELFFSLSLLRPSAAQSSIDFFSFFNAFYAALSLAYKDVCAKRLERCVGFFVLSSVCQRAIGSASRSSSADRLEESAPRTDRALSLAFEKKKTRPPPPLTFSLSLSLSLFPPPLRPLIFYPQARPGTQGTPRRRAAAPSTARTSSLLTTPGARAGAAGAEEGSEQTGALLFWGGSSAPSRSRASCSSPPPSAARESGSSSRR